MKSEQNFIPSLYQRVLVPGVLFSLLVFILGVAWTSMASPKSLYLRILLIIGFTGSLLGTASGLFFIQERYSSGIPRWTSWLHVVVVGGALGLVQGLIPAEFFFVAYILLILNLIRAILMFSVIQVRSLILVSFFVHFHIVWSQARLTDLTTWFFVISLPILNLLIAETLWRFQETTLYHLKRLTTVNALTRKLSSSLDEQEVHTWFKEAIQDIFDADTYYLALLDGDFLDLGLFYDDGEYFTAVKVPIAGTLGGWTICNEKTLFLNDLRIEPELDGVRTCLIGKEKSSLSWLGVPFKTEYVTGLAGIASYEPLAFTKRDVEMLESLTQQAALALNNARQHALVTMQARTDSLTQVYTHGYFIENLTEELKTAKEKGYPLSLIMLDVDYFKRYNDTYGHLVGDEVLLLLVKTIRRFIKARDSIGRWGGEEFAICLPKTSLTEAQIVAVRIQETLKKMKINVPSQKNIPVPTVSQGIAEFPAEAQKAFFLVDLADQRLYTAKERGRNQIEPPLVGGT